MPQHHPRTMATSSVDAPHCKPSTSLHPRSMPTRQRVAGALTQARYRLFLDSLYLRCKCRPTRSRLVGCHTCRGHINRCWSNSSKRIAAKGWWSCGSHYYGFHIIAILEGIALYGGCCGRQVNLSQSREVERITANCLQ